MLINSILFRSCLGKKSRGNKKYNCISTASVQVCNKMFSCAFTPKYGLIDPLKSVFDKNMKLRLTCKEKRLKSSGSRTMAAIAEQKISITKYAGAIRLIRPIIKSM